MMKTAGSSLIKSLIQHYGTKVLNVSYRVRLNMDVYENEHLLRDLKKNNNKVSAIVGHSMRPFIDYDVPKHNLRWMTFLRNPFERYVSNYFYMYKLKNVFLEKHYDTMKAVNIVEWEKVEQLSNYQCKFISGEANAQKAIDVLENKFDWVGITEEFEIGIDSFKTHFGLENLYFDYKITNSSTAELENKKRTKIKYEGFIKEMNQEDQILYDYVKKEMWPRFNNQNLSKSVKFKTNTLQRNFNTLNYHINDQLKFKETKLTWNNIKQFYLRWYR